MKALILLALILSSFSLWAKCPDTDDSVLSGEQIMVKNLLKSAYKLQNESIITKDLAAYSNRLQLDYGTVAEYLDAREISSIIIEQDADNNICANKTIPSFQSFNRVISDRIVEIYMGCGCDH